MSDTSVLSGWESFSVPDQLNQSPYDGPRPQATRFGFDDYARAVDKIDPNNNDIVFKVALVLAKAVRREELTADEASKLYHEWCSRHEKYNPESRSQDFERALNDYSDGYGGVTTLLRYAEDCPAPRVDPATGEPEPQADCWFVIDSKRTHNIAAQKFVEKYGSRVRHVAAWNKWLVWDERRWVIDSNEVAVKELISHFAESLWQHFPRNLPGGEATKVYNFLRSLNNVGGIQAIETVARGKPGVTCHYNDLDANPFLLNVENGTLNMKTGELQPHDPTDMITKLANVVYNPNATCPKWNETMRLVYLGDEKLIAYVEQLLGYSLTGDTGEAILPILYGHGNNGKSTIWNTVSKMGGEYVEMGSDTLLLGEKNSHPTEMADLFGKRIIVINEPDEGSALKEGRLKYLTGDPTIKARRMHEDLWEFQRSSSFLLVTNHLPKIRSLDNGLRRRIKQIPHDADFGKIEGFKVIKNYADILAREEGSGILNRLIAGLHRYLENEEFGQPEAVTNATEEYFNEEDTFGRFLTECCELDSDAWATADELYEAYQQVAGRDASTQNSFGRTLAMRTGTDRTRRRVQGKQVTVYEGIRLIDSQRSG